MLWNQLPKFPLGSWTNKLKITSPQKYWTKNFENDVQWFVLESPLGSSNACQSLIMTLLKKLNLLSKIFPQKTLVLAAINGECY